MTEKPKVRNRCERPVSSRAIEKTSKLRQPSIDAGCDVIAPVQPPEVLGDFGPDRVTRIIGDDMVMERFDELLGA